MVDEGTVVREREDGVGTWSNVWSKRQDTLVTYDYMEGEVRGKVCVMNR